jgi:hypothetical protein
MKKKKYSLSDNFCLKTRNGQVIYIYDLYNPLVGYDIVTPCLRTKTGVEEIGDPLQVNSPTFYVRLYKAIKANLGRDDELHNLYYDFDDKGNIRINKPLLRQITSLIYGRDIYYISEEVEKYNVVEVLKEIKPLDPKAITKDYLRKLGNKLRQYLFGFWLIGYSDTSEAFLFYVNFLDDINLYLTSPEEKDFTRELDIFRNALTGMLLANLESDIKVMRSHAKRVFEEIEYFTRPASDRFAPLKTGAEMIRENAGEIAVALNVEYGEVMDAASDLSYFCEFGDTKHFRDGWNFIEKAYKILGIA